MKDTKSYTLLGTAIVVLLIVASYLYKQVFIVPENFPVQKNFVINENESLKSISDRLKVEGYISSPLLFRAGISYFNKDRAVQIGSYIFSTPLTLFGIVRTFVNGRPTLPLLSVTIPEGSTSFEIATILIKALPSLSLQEFNALVAQYNAEGRLYPSTYFLLPSYKESDVIALMLTTFNKKVGSVVANSKINPPLTNDNDVLVLASILEGEAKGDVDMRIVAGILLKRLSQGMPLQVDVAKETYKKKGLPKTPLNNPGLIAINAVLNPTDTPYLFYLTGKDGNMYYAKTFAEHKKNIQKYLK